MDNGQYSCLCSAAVADWVQCTSENVERIFISVSILLMNKWNGFDNEALMELSIYHLGLTLKFRQTTRTMII